MPNIRCKYYDDAGHPRNGGCLRIGRGCAFVHPTDANWNTAGPSLPAGVKRHYDQTRARGGPGGIRRANRESHSSGWGAPTSSHEKPSDSSWDTSEWGLGGSSKTSSQWGSSRAGEKPSNTGGWGGSADTSGGGWASSDPPQQGSTSQASWGPSGGADQSGSAAGWSGDSGGGGWGNPGRGKGNASASAWGTDADSTAASQSAWSSVPPPSSKDSGGPWKESAAASTWGAENWPTSSAPSQPQSNDFSNEREGRPLAETRGSLDSSAIWSQRLPRGVKNDRKERSPAGPGNESTATSGRRWSPLVPQPPTSVKRDDASSEATVVPGDVTMTDWTEVSRAKDGSFASYPTSLCGTEQTSTTSRVNPNLTAETDDEKTITHAIKLFAIGIRLDNDIRTAESERDMVKRIQNATLYSHVGHAGRKKLDAERWSIESKLAEYRKQQSAVLKELAAAIDPSAKLSDPDPKTIEDVKQYTTEVKEWMGHVQKAYPKITPSLEQQEAGLSNAHLTQSPPPSPSTQALEEGDGLRSYFVSRILDLETKMDKIQSDVLISTYATVCNSLDEKIEQRLGAMKLSSSAAEEGECTPEPLSPSPELSQKVEALGEKVLEIATDAASILTGLDHGSGEVQKWKAENEVMRREQDAMLGQLTECEDRLRAKSEQLEVLKQELAPLLEHTSRPPPPPSEEGSSDLNIAEFRESLNSHIEKEIDQSVVPLLAQLKLNYTNELQRYKDDIFGSLRTQAKSSPSSVSEAFSVLLGHNSPTAIGGCTRKSYLAISGCVESLIPYSVASIKQP